MADKIPNIIYLVHGDSPGGYDWCANPKPSDDHDPDEAIKYLKAGTDRHNLIDEIIGRVKKLKAEVENQDGMMAFAYNNTIVALRSMRDDN